MKNATFLLKNLFFFDFFTFFFLFFCIFQKKVLYLHRKMVNFAFTSAVIACSLKRNTHIKILYNPF